MQSNEQKLAQEMQFRIACVEAITAATSHVAGVRLNLGFNAKLRITTSHTALLVGGA